MSRRDDINELYLPSQRLEQICKLIFWLNIILSIVSLFLTGFLFDVSSTLQIALAIAFVAISLIDDGLCWYNAECERRKNNIQTAFGIRFSEMETDGYYNNTFSPSIIKYAVNTFESNFFSKFIASKMLFKSAIKSLFSIIALISVGWIIVNGSILLIITQAIFSAYIIEDSVLLAIYTIRMNKLYDAIYSMFVTSGIYRKQQIPILLLYCVEYECIKAHYKVRLDSKIFTKYNNTLSEKWNAIESKINVELHDKNMRS